jgi:glucosamine-6-phosphate deaminase
MQNSEVPTHVRTWTADALSVRAYPTHEALAEDAARITHHHLLQLLSSQGHAAAILASAASQVKFLDVLTSLPGLDWSRITLFHMDEYLGISPEHPASFRRFMRERVAGRVQPRAFHFLEGDALEPIRECDRYATLLRQQPIDLCVLGIGENGHVAFNDPPVANFDDPLLVKIVKLDEACRQQQVGEGAFPNLESVPQYAFSLTIPALCSARKMLCVVPEKRKATAVKATLEGQVSVACPASILRRQPHATLLLDSDSASELSARL